jgi:hypothetical protein
MADAILDGLQKGMVAAGIDIGASADLVVDDVIVDDQSQTVA